METSTNVTQFRLRTVKAERLSLPRRCRCYCYSHFETGAAEQTMTPPKPVVAVASVASELLGAAVVVPDIVLLLLLLQHNQPALAST